MICHDLGHVCRGRRIPISAHSNFGILSNLGTSSIFTWVYAGIASAACPSQSGSPAMTSITLCGGHLWRRWALFCKYGVGFLSRLWRSLLEVRHDLCNSETSAPIPHFLRCHMSINVAINLTSPRRSLLGCWCTSWYRRSATEALVNKPNQTPRAKTPRGSQRETPRGYNHAFEPKKRAAEKWSIPRLEPTGLRWLSKQHLWEGWSRPDGQTVPPAKLRLTGSWFQSAMPSPVSWSMLSEVAEVVYSKKR